MTVTDDILEALEAIRSTGPLSPSRVLRVAQHPDSILHPLFEWDNDKAAHEHRLAQARRLISTRVIRPEGSARTLTAYVNVPSPDGEGEYVPIQTIVRQPDRLALVRDAALRLLGAAQDNVSELDEAVRLYGKPERAAEQAVRTQRARVLIEDAQTQLAAV